MKRNDAVHFHKCQTFIIKIHLQSLLNRVPAMSGTTKSIWVRITIIYLVTCFKK